MDDLRNSLKHFSKRLDHYSRRNYRQLVAEACQDPYIHRFIDHHHLNQAAIERSASKIYECFNENRKIASNQPSLVPGYHPKLVMNGNLVDVTYIPTSQTAWQRTYKKHLGDLKLIGESDLVRNCTFDRYYYQIHNDQGSRIIALEAAKKFIHSYLSHSKGYHRGMYLYGGIGRGKTFLLSAIANDLCSHGVSVTLLNFPIFTVELKNEIKRDDTLAVTKRISKSPVLMIDDLGADGRSRWIRDNVLAIMLEYRTQHYLPTFFSSNISMNNLQRDYLTVNGNGTLEPIKAERIMSRIDFLAKEYEIKGDDLRRKLSNDHGSK